MLETMILKLILLGPLLKALSATRKPILCGVLYGLALLTNSVIFDLALGADPGKTVAYLLANTIAGLGYFWLLQETEDTPIYWGVMILGAGLLCALPG